MNKLNDNEITHELLLSHFDCKKSSLFETQDVKLHMLGELSQIEHVDGSVRP